MFGLNPPELLIILVIVLIIFGVGKLPQIGGALGKSIREFRESSEGQQTTNLEQAAKAPQPEEQKKSGI